MHDPNQIEVPASFLALFTSPYGQKLTEPIATVRDRYELCEDLAQMLVERAGAGQSGSGGDEREVLAKMRGALTGAGSPVQPAEAVWVTRRLAELLGWEDPGEG
ncbi:MAG: hypothetical protein JWP41_2384 [Ramlibacter sp.]|nr:hypothetical protein [Ramlibacter sp.]